ncbi:hypothetical protein [Waddlia chondrophila]|uniref:Putative membrane protein n=1 Tax=Waddlia chondrophila (strain ATCC VR-1470 / WSU 86-1044) TaxID=716544 RepID=D6YW79_WADCW|nr:hypothetical protein [Waddlia chondrophila]ADI38390.1 putative membrane protein [Waddlia chondrophila WSU 86-1044]
MAVSLDLDCGDVFNQFSKEGKFADVSKNFFESRSNYYKLTKHTVEYAFAIAEVTSIVPLQFIPIFEAIRSIVTVAFKALSIYHNVEKIKKSHQELALCKVKVEKWSQEHRDDAPFDRHSLFQLRDRYLGKIQLLQEKPEKEAFDRFRKNRWQEYLKLIEDAIEGTDAKAMQVLQSKFAMRKERKAASWQKKEHDLHLKIKKSYLEIAISIGGIALEAMTIISIAFIPLSAGSTFIAVKLGSNILVGAMEYGKYLWWSTHKKENPGVIAIKSIEHIGTSVAKTKLLPYSSVMHPSLIKGACKTAFSLIRVFHSRYNYMDNHYAIGECKRNIEHLKKKNIVLMQASHKIASGDRKEMFRILNKYETKKNGALSIIQDYEEALEREETTRNPDELIAMIGIMKADIKKWERYIEALRRALDTNDLSDAKIAANCLCERNGRRISNWKLSEQLHQKNNLKEGMKTALSIVEIARFAFLITAISLALVGMGINLLPYLFASSLFANVLYMAYAWFTMKTNKEIDGIIDLWSRDEIAPSTF